MQKNVVLFVCFYCFGLFGGGGVVLFVLVVFWGGFGVCFCLFISLFLCLPYDRTEVIY